MTQSNDQTFGQDQMNGVDLYGTQPESLSNTHPHKLTYSAILKDM